MFVQSETLLKPGELFKVTSRILSQEAPANLKKLSDQSRKVSVESRELGRSKEASQSRHD
jgi:hypothetical protein